jgi:hypothetical protein
MENKLDSLITKLENMFESLLGEFEKHPVRVSIKILLVIYVLRFVKRSLVR